MSSKRSQQTIKRKKVTVNLDATHIREVIIAGDFNGWDYKKHAMIQNGDGTWQRSLMVAPGKYEYKFRVDGQWLKIPTIINPVPIVSGLATASLRYVENSSL